MKPIITGITIASCVLMLVLSFQPLQQQTVHAYNMTEAQSSCVFGKLGDLIKDVKDDPNNPFNSLLGASTLTAIKICLKQ